MAYKDSGEMAVDPKSYADQTYNLGSYSFRLHIEMNEGQRQVICHASGPEGNAQHGISIDAGTQIIGWSVEANEDTADVYVTVIFPNYQVIPNTDNLSESAAEAYCVSLGGHLASIHSAAENATIRALANSAGASYLLIGGTGYGRSKTEGWSWTDGTAWDYQNWDANEPNASGHYVQMYSSGSWDDYPDGQVKTHFVLKRESAETSPILVARFAIDIRDADGGPGGDWDEPGDTGDPSYTLNFNVNGASAGTHDAAVVPLPPADQPVYGSGGTGGNGGGGGAGQSTVIVRRFATDKAGSVNQEVTLRPPGVGGKGGPGGKGGDGCILIFY